MQPRIFILMPVAALSACSLIADPDAFTYVEGSATDEHDTTVPSQSTDDTDLGNGTETENDTGADIADPDSDTETNGPVVCKTDDDCRTGYVCPILFYDDLFQEEESRCYKNCRVAADACADTPNPLCYQYPGGAICLSRTAVSGTFACRVLTPTVGNQIELKIRPEEPPIRLERCEMFSDDNGFGFIFSTVTTEGVIEAGFYVPDVRIGDLQTGFLENAEGEVFRKVLDADMSPTESTMLAFFPSPDVEQTPPLTRDLDVQEISGTGPIRGEIQFEGFAYDAKMSL